jgi:penicillin-binding protein 1A
MANIGVGPFSPGDFSRRGLSELEDRVRRLQEDYPHLRNPAVLGALATLLLIVLLGLAAAVFALYLMYSPLDLPKPIEGSKAASTEILAADGSVIEQWHGPINRTPVDLKEMSDHLQEAAVAAEDARFYSRGAVDLRAVMRAAKANLLNGEMVQGGSTISQQYAKNVYVGNAPTISRKIKEARVAYRLERDMGKNRVLEGYLNTVYFGRGAYGVEAASNIYFGKPAAEASLSEAAQLIGMVRSPDSYSPYERPVRSEERRRWVLGRMEKLGSITPAERQEAEKARPVLTPAAAAHPRYGWYMDALRTYLLRRYGSEKVYSGGLKVQTTIDLQAQEAAEITVANALPEAGDPYAALASIDPATGYVRAVVGGRDYSDEKYNIAVQGRRQPGSAFKPLVLVAALEEGIPPSAGYRAPRTICPKGWVPTCVSNYGRSGYGWLSLEQATVKSVNTVYAQLILQVGPKKVVDVARRMGIPGPDWMPPRSGCTRSADDACATRLEPVPAMALGSEEVTPLELASVYATLAAGGVYREPKLVSRVVDGDGRVLEEGPSEPQRAISEEVAETVNGILAKVITQGTGTRADFGRPAAGKTGTAQDHGNAWFSGYTPQLATAVWVGYRNSNQPLLNVQGIRQVAGGTLPAEMWREYMKGVSDRTPPTLELGSDLPDGVFTQERVLELEGSAVDSDGMVQGVELSIDGGPFASAGVTCSRCPGPEIRWSYEAPTPLDEGEHTVTIRAFDKAGHRSEPQTRRLTVDTRPPALERAAATGGAAGIEVAFDEPVACRSVSPGAFSVTVDGDRARVGSAACAGEAGAQIDLTLVRPVRGGDQVVVDLGRPSRAPSDRAGNDAGPGAIRVRATNMKPAAALDAAAGPGPFTAEEVEVTGTARDPDGTLEAVMVSIDKGPFSSAGISCRDCGKRAEAAWVYRPAQPLSDGRHKLVFLAEDNAGEASGRQARNVTVDAVAPKLESIASTGGSAMVKARFSEPISCDGVRPSGFEAQSQGRRVMVVGIGCAGITAEVLELDLATPARGGDRISLSIRDRPGAPADVAGNPSTADTRSGEAANLAPVLEFAPEAVQGPVTADRVVGSGTAVDPDGVVESIEVSVDEGPFTSAGVDCSRCGRPGEAAWTFEPKVALGNGEHQLAFRSVDNAGDASSARSVKLTIDSIPPTLQDIKAQGGDATVELRFNEDLACSTNAASRFRARVDARRTGVASAACDGSLARLTLSRAPDGGERVEVVLRAPSRRSREVTDTAGNPVGGVSRTVVAVNRRPVVQMPQPGPGVFDARPPGERVVLEGTASDPDGVIETVEASLDGAEFSARWVECRGCRRQGAVTFTVELDQAVTSGTHTLAVRAGDGSATMSEPFLLKLAHDVEPPVLESLSGRAGASSLRAGFSERLDCSTVDAADFSVTVKGAHRPVLSVRCSGSSDDDIDLRISGRVREGESVSLETKGSLGDVSGNLVAQGARRRLKV